VEVLVNSTIAAPVPVPAGRSAAWCAVASSAEAVQVLAFVPVVPEMGEADAVGLGAVEDGAVDGDEAEDGVDGEEADDGALLVGVVEEDVVPEAVSLLWQAESDRAAESAATASAVLRMLTYGMRSPEV
jgi:hypothetical protein